VELGPKLAAIDLARLPKSGCSTSQPYASRSVRGTMWSDPKPREEIAMATVGLLVRLQANPGKEADVASFLEGGLALVEEEPATTAWFAIQFGPSEFGIFDVFPDNAGREAHLAGRVAEALMARASELFAQPPAIEPVDVLAAKLPS